jgi:hypothetical protein
MATSTASHLPIEMVQVLRAALLERADASESEEQRRIILSMDASMVANRIIKDEATDRRLHIITIARRLKYCFDA